MSRESQLSGGIRAPPGPSHWLENARSGWSHCPGTSVRVHAASGGGAAGPAPLKLGKIVDLASYHNPDQTPMETVVDMSKLGLDRPSHVYGRLLGITKRMYKGHQALDNEDPGFSLILMTFPTELVFTCSVLSLNLPFSPALFSHFYIFIRN